MADEKYRMVSLAAITSERRNWMRTGLLGRLIRAFASDGRDRRQAMARVAQLLAIPVPVVGAINGQALGREFVLTLACDDCGGHRGCEARDDRRTGRRPLCGGTSRDHAARAFSGTI